MYLGYFYAVRGAVKQQERLDVLASNLANASTPGFKQDKVCFEDYLLAQVKTDFSQGAVRQTERPLDLALQGPGFLKIMTPNGPAYTRDGSLRIDSQGNLLTNEGHPVLGEGGAIQVGEERENITIDSKGNISAGENQVGALSLVELVDKTHLKREGGSVLAWTGPGQPEEVQALEVEVLQGHLEQPNVNLVREMASMIESHRAFEAYIKTIQSFAEMDSKAATQVGRLRS
ncbi:MAG: flagellar hook-basal body protein [Deltaproteobacteria bacterium]|nr:flagellar hook-basal body protein [Deltaproteobacteria bacterium]